MLEKLPEEIMDAVRDLEKAENQITRNRSITEYLNALDDLELCKEDFPEHNTYIENIKTTYINRLIDLLYTQRPELDAKSWLAIFSTIMVKNKALFSEKLQLDDNIKEYFVHFLGLYIDETPAELEKILIDNF